ncbi:hypothetical protein ANANG_G00160090, partial [Anguilla anguilla]
FSVPLSLSPSHLCFWGILHTPVPLGGHSAIRTEGGGPRRTPGIPAGGRRGRQPPGGSWGRRGWAALCRRGLPGIDTLGRGTPEEVVLGRGTPEEVVLGRGTPEQKVLGRG